MFILAVPWLLLALFLITIAFYTKKKWVYTLLFTIITVAINFWSDCFCLGTANNNSGEIKILCFNINGAGSYNKKKTESIIKLIIEEDPDVVFLTENFYPIRDSLFDRLHEKYPYETRYMAHNILFSKYPLQEQVFHERPDDGNGYIVQSKIIVNDTPLVLYGCHLSSNNYSSDLEYLTPRSIRSISDIKTYFDNISYAALMRKREADIVAQSFNESDNVIVMGDFNDICGSETLKTFSKVGLIDAWSEGGFGYGATIHLPLPYRIDHIMYNDKLKLKGIKKIDTSDISDHDALVAVFDFNKD